MVRLAVQGSLSVLLLTVLSNSLKIACREAGEKKKLKVPVLALQIES